MSAAFKIDGDDELLKALNDIGKKAAKAVIRKAIQKQASDSVKQIRQRAPVHTDDALKSKGKITKKGTLKKAVKAKRRKPRGDVYQSNVIVEHGNSVKNDAYYWHMVEYGTVNMPAQPFIRPVENEKRTSAEPEVQEAITKGVEDKLQKAVD